MTLTETFKSSVKTWTEKTITNTEAVSPKATQKTKSSVCKCTQDRPSRQL